MYGRLIAPEIEELIAARDFATIRDVVLDWEPVELADLLADLREEGVMVEAGREAAATAAAVKAGT